MQSSRSVGHRSTFGMRSIYQGQSSRFATIGAGLASNLGGVGIFPGLSSAAADPCRKSSAATDEHDLPCALDVFRWLACSFSDDLAT
jgi:hypothetical protein